MREKSRGQALIETAVFLPLVLLAMLAVIYFSQYGVLQGRAAQAVRYATLVSNGGTAAQGNSSLFTIESMYAELTREGQSAQAGQSDPGYPVSNYACTSAGQAANLALTQQESMPNGAVAATAAPTFFQPDSAPTVLCTPEAVPMPNGNVNIAPSYMMVQFTSVSAAKDTPSWLRALGFAKSQQFASSGMAYTLPAAPGAMMYCSQTFGSLLSSSFASLPMIVPNTVSTPYGMYPSPPANPTARTGC